MKITPMSVDYVDHMGNDDSVVNAARVSFNKRAENYTKDQNNRLINYLAKNSHWTPLAHNSITLRIKAPIFIARQAGKHQVGLVWNEVSRRYVDDEPEFWFPKEWRGRPVNAKQGSNGIVDINYIHPGWHTPEDLCEEALTTYTYLLSAGVAPEQARMVLPQNMQTEWYWTGSLAAFARVCKLRLDPHAQQEIQELAGGIAAVVEPLFPVSWKALMS